MGLENIDALNFSSGDLSDLATLYNILETLKNGVVSFGRSQHADDGVHKIATGLGLASRPSAAVAGRAYYDRQNEKLYIDKGDAWGKAFSNDAGDVSYAVVGIDSISTVEDALNRLFALVGEDPSLDAEAINYGFASPSFIIGQSGTVDIALQGICSWLLSINSGNIAHGDSTVAAVLASLSSFSAGFGSTSGAASIGFNDTGLANVDANDVQNAIADLDAAITNLSGYSPDAMTVTNTNPDGFFGTSVDIQSEINQIGELLRTQMEDYVYMGCYIAGTVSSNTMAWKWYIPFNIGVGHIIDLEALNWHAHLGTAPSSTVTVQFNHTRCNDICTLQIPASGQADIDSVTEYDDIAVGDTFWINVTGSSGANLSAGFTLRLLRGY